MYKNAILSETIDQGKLNNQKLDTANAKLGHFKFLLFRLSIDAVSWDDHESGVLFSFRSLSVDTSTTYW